MDALNRFEQERVEHKRLMQALLDAIRARLKELKKLLEECSDHWGYEDPIYRFYHQSIKICDTQYTTERIVDALQSLLPERKLNAWFAQIVREGTRSESEPDRNRTWLAENRPIVEAFFHARFMLEMAVRYSDLEEPPQMLPSGWAALLYLFDLR
jgi:hypothetical protein